MHELKESRWNDNAFFYAMTFNAGEAWRKKQIRKITDRVFQNIRNQIQTENLSFEDLYIAVLLVYK